MTLAHLAQLRNTIMFQNYLILKEINLPFGGSAHSPSISQLHQPGRLKIRLERLKQITSIIAILQNYISYSII